MENMALTPCFWAGKRVLLTGHTGFKGSWMSLWLTELGAEVVGYSLPPLAPPCNFAASRVEERLQRSIYADIRDFLQVAKCVAEFKPDIVFHMAAQPLVRFSYQEPMETFETNIMGTVHVLEAIRRHPSAKAIVVVTSDKCYENREWAWGYREYEAMGGHDPYSSSKGCAELVTASYRSSFFAPDDHSQHGVGLATARAGNVIGGGDCSIDRLVPDLLRAHLRHDELVIRNPASIRPWQYVLEPLSGYLILAERLFKEGTRYAEAWNFGPSHEDAIPVKELIERLSSRLDGKLNYRIQTNPAALHEASVLKLDCSKATARLGWRPRTTIDDALGLIAEWHNGLLEGDDMQALSLSQINKFQLYN